jgi:hypothetical protein
MLPDLGLQDRERCVVERHANRFAALGLIGMRPITHVDDVTFVDRLRKNVNLPEWLRSTL